MCSTGSPPSAWRGRARNAGGAESFAVSEAIFSAFSCRFTLPGAEEGFDLKRQADEGATPIAVREGQDGGTGHASAGTETAQAP